MMSARKNAAAALLSDGRGVGVAATETQFLNEGANVVVQLVNSESDICWEARYPAPAVKNSTTQFKDRIP